MAGNIRVYELARELGMTNKETLDLCEALGIGVKSHSSSVVDAQADRVRRKAEREGLIRDEQPPEPDKKPAKKAAKSTKKAAAPTEESAPAAEPVVADTPAATPDVVEAELTAEADAETATLSAADSPGQAADGTPEAP